MSTLARRPRRRPGAASGFAAVLCAVLAACAIASEAADGALTDSVAVTTTVDSVLSVADTCSSAMSISVTLSAYTSDTCAFQFGATNDATTTLRISSSAGNLLSGGVIADHSGGCGVLANDTVGVKVSGTGAGVTSALGCTVSAAGTNADFLAAPDTFTNTCAGTTVGATANTCTLAVGVKAGATTAAGAYNGTIDVDVIG